MAYSYAAWLGGAIVTPSLPTYRAVGYIAAVAALVALFSLVRTVASSNAAWLAVALTCVSLPFVAVATTARFYAPFLLFYLLTLRALARSADALGPSANTLSSGAAFRIGGDVQPSGVPAWSLVGVAALSFLARGTHELAFTLAAVPIAAMLFVPAIATARLGGILGGGGRRARCLAARARRAPSASAGGPAGRGDGGRPASSEPPSMLARFSCGRSSTSSSGRWIR